MPNSANTERKRILWVKSGPLHPLDTGGKKRTYNMARELNREHSVTFIALLQNGTPADVTAAAAEYSNAQIWIPWEEPGRGKLALGWQLLTNALASSLPYVLAKYRSRAMADKIAELDAAGDFDLIVCDFLTPAVNLPRDLRTPSVLFQHNMEAQIWQRLAAGKSNPISRLYFSRQFSRMHRWEERLSRRFDGVIAVSEEDATYARDVYELENVLGAVPTGVDFEHFAAAGKSEGSHTPPIVGFLGSMDWMPNIEATKYFVSEIYALLKQQLPEVRFLVIGRNPPPEVRALADVDSSIEVTGTVDDVRPYLGRCTTLAVPLLSGGGTRIKIMEAVAAGLPVVSTSVGAEGLNLEPGRDIAIADAPEAFARELAQVCTDNEHATSLATSALTAIRDGNSWRVCTETFLAHCRQVMR